MAPSTSTDNSPAGGSKDSFIVWAERLKPRERALLACVAIGANRAAIDWDETATKVGYKNAGVAKTRFGQIVRGQNTERTTPSNIGGTTGAGSGSGKKTATAKTQSNKLTKASGVTKNRGGKNISQRAMQRTIDKINNEAADEEDDDDEETFEDAEDEFDEKDELDDASETPVSGTSFATAKTSLSKGGKKPAGGGAVKTKVTEFGSPMRVKPETQGLNAAALGGVPIIMSLDDAKDAGIKIEDPRTARINPAHYVSDSSDPDDQGGVMLPSELRNKPGQRGASLSDEESEDDDDDNELDSEPDVVARHFARMKVKEWKKIFRRAGENDDSSGSEDVILFKGWKNTSK